MNGFTGTISLSVSGLPANATGTFNPTSVSVGSSSTLTITTASNTPTGSSTLTIKGTGSSLTNTTTATLIVTSSSGGSGNAISVDFVGEDVAMAPTEVAGVVPEPNWNDASGVSSSSPLTLMDDTGSCDNSDCDVEFERHLGNAHHGSARERTDDEGLSGYWQQFQHYDGDCCRLACQFRRLQVYVYADGDNGSATRTGIYTISGAGITTTTIDLTDAANTNFSGTFTLGKQFGGQLRCVHY